MILLLVFFFQAEDGIRDKLVTGVQTCALPIFRLTADGKLRTCLFSKDDHDLRFLLRDGASDDEIRDFICANVMEKEEGHRINEPGFVPPSRTMVFIGG